MAYDILGIGAALVDTEILVDDEDLNNLKIDKGLMTLCDEAQQGRYLRYLREHIDGAHRACGGSAANSMIASSLLGCRVHLTCQVADDSDGRFFLRDLGHAGVSCNSRHQARPGVTGKCLVMVTPDAERTMNTALCISETLSTRNIEPDIFENAGYLYLEGYLATSTSCMDAAISMREQARQNGAAVSISLSDPGIAKHFEPELRAMIGGRADLIFCNAHEAMQWTHTDSISDAAEKLKEDTRTYAITLGPDGALVFDGSETCRVDSPRVEAIDTNGAGDMFAGTFLAAICQGKNFAEAAALACQGAAQVVSRMGPRLDNDGYRLIRGALQSG